MSHWEKQAQKWDFLGAPLKPSTLDIENTQAWIDKMPATKQKSFNVLLLGVTPELVNLRWPSNTKLIAIDMNTTMLQMILPEQAKTKPHGIQGNWVGLPFREHVFDLVIGDGCYSSLAHKDYAHMTQEIKRVLKHDGTYIMRFFLRAEINESVASLLKEMTALKLQNFHALKLRLAMAMQTTLAEGVCLQDVWHCWVQHFQQHAINLKNHLNWDEAVIATIQHYQENFTRYTFPTINEIETHLAEHFTEITSHFPQYSLGLQCPTLKIRLPQ